MYPVVINAFDVIGEHTADGVVAFGAAVYRTAAKRAKACLCAAAASNMIGIVVDDMIERTVDGFYASYDPMPIVSAGRCRVWVTPNESDISLIAGDNLELAVLGSSNALPVGVFEEAGSTAGETRTTVTMARTLEDVTLTSALKYVLTESGEDVTVGDTTITLTTTKVALFAVGDYILLEDLDGNVMINRVTAKSGAVLTLALASTVALTGATDYIHILTQAEVILI